MRNLYLVSLLLFITTCALRGQVFTTYESFSELEQRIQQAGSKTTTVINFWATWCGPCVEELSYFQELHQNFAGPDFQILLISLDMKNRLDKSLIPFLEKHQPKSEVILLSDQDADSWIPKVHPNWEGTIPATVVIRGEQRALFSEQFASYAELETFVTDFLKKVQKAIPHGISGTR